MKKYFALFLLSLGGLCAADYMTGQAARVVIGQATFTAQDDSSGGVSPNILGAVGSVAYANGILVEADSNRISATPQLNRVLVYSNLQQTLPKPQDSISPPQYLRCPVCIGTSDTPMHVVTLGDPTGYTAYLNPPTAMGFRNPSGVATDGKIIAVADTDNNRVLIWTSIPTADNTPANIVLGQKDFVTVTQPPVVDNKSFRGPQGLWIQGTRLFVADTQNNRVMVWNTIPTANDQPADYVLGVPNFTSPPIQDLTKAPPDAHPNTLLNPVSVTSDGTRLFVTDLGYARVLIWNQIPTQTQQPADVVLGQPDFTSVTDNNSAALCASNGTNSTTNQPTYPQRCAATLSFPRYALSDGTRLYIADGGNDRILVFNTMPAQNGQRADVIIGQPDEFSDNTTDVDQSLSFRPDDNINRSSADAIRTPLSLATDGTNLYAADPFSRRILVFSPGESDVPVNGIRNAASRDVTAIGTVDFSGTINANDTATITINGTAYTYTVTKEDTIASIITNLVTKINANGGDPNVLAIANPDFNEIVLHSKLAGGEGNNITLAVSTSTNAQIVLTASGANLERGGTAAEVAPGTLISIFGNNLSDNTVSADVPPPGQGYPQTLGGVEVYFDGMRAPLTFVSPTQINAQVPFELLDTTSSSSFIRIKRNDGTVVNTTAINAPIVLENPGVFAYEGDEPRQAIAYHGPANAMAVVDFEGGIKAGDVATVGIGSNTYTYTVTSSDTLASVRDNFVSQINANANELVTATPSGQYSRMVLIAKASGSDGEGIGITGSSNTGAQLAVTALQSATCCDSSTPGMPVTQDNPAIAGELITIYATGLGVVGPDDAKNSATTGVPYNGPPAVPGAPGPAELNYSSAPVDDAQVGGSTANVLYAGLAPGLIGVYEIQLQLNQSIPTNPQTQMYIAQDVFTSNITTIPVVNPNPPSQ